MAKDSSSWCVASALLLGCAAPVAPDPSPPASPPTESPRTESSIVLAQLGSGAFRVHGPLDGVAFVPDGKRIVAVSQTAGVYVFDRATGRIQLHLPFEGDIADMALLPDGDSVLVSGRGGVHRYSLHEQAEGTPLLPVETQTGAIDVDATGEHLVVTDGGAALRVLSVETGDELAKFGGFANYEDAVFVPRSDWVAASLSDRVGLWNWHTGDREHQLPTSQIGRFAVGADGRWIAVVGYGKGPEVSLWSLDNGERRHVLAVGSTGTLASTPDGGLLLVNENTDVGVWDVRTGQRRLSLSPTSSYDRTMAVSADGKTLAAGGNDHTIGLWSLADGSYETPRSGHRGEVLQLAFSPDGKRLVSASYGDQRAIVWDLEESRALFEVEAPNGFGAAAFDPKGGGLLVVENGWLDGQQMVRTSETGEVLVRWNAKLSLVRDAHWLGDGQLALAEGGRISVLPIEGRSASWQSKNLFDDGDLTSDGEASFSADGSRAVVYGGTRWMVVDLAARSVRQRGSVAACKFVDQAVIAADGDVVVGSETEFDAEDGLVILWRNGVRERALPVERSPRALASDRDAGRIAFATEKEVGVWDPVGGRVWTVERTVPTALAMTPDGERLAVGFGNGTIEVWDVDVMMRRVEAADAAKPGTPEACPEDDGLGEFGAFGFSGGRPAAEIYQGMFEPPAD